jgi:acyl-CoA synthetase (AMP-forming)/AMP-acid ligase II
MTENAFFWDEINGKGNAVALTTNTKELTYVQMDEAARQITREIPARSFVFLVCKNCLASVAGYVGFLQKHIVPVLLNSTIDKGLFIELREHYQPQYIWCPDDFVEDDGNQAYEGYKLVATSAEAPKMDDELAIMLTTSGSTGSPKFVRQTYRNIQANTASIVEYLGIVPEDHAITTLPMSYTYGLSIIQSHLMAGAEIVLTDQTFFDRGFWDFFREKCATTFGAVPYNYQMLDRLRFLRMNLPTLRYITQAGGRLGEELHYKFASGMREQGKALVVMYGATEATARMSYVPTDHAVEKAGSIGIAIPGGRFELIDVDESIISETDKVGELVYYGNNVTLGYAECREDLAKGDERNGRLETGDMAKRDEDGYYYVVGRKKRFLKIFGNRVNLVEIEELLNKAGYETACVGEDDQMRIYTTSNDVNGMVNFISEKTGLNRAAFIAIHIDVIPHNDSGKVMYSELK